jgi:putative effector of murein hydrolase LrgA (UPF0299 family)
MDNIFLETYDDFVDITNKCGTACKVLTALCITSVILIPSGIAVGLYIDQIAGITVFCIGGSIMSTIIFYFTVAYIGKCVKCCEKPPLLPLTRG